MTDTEWTFGRRRRTILGDAAPAIVPMDGERRVATRRRDEREPEELLAAFESLRKPYLATRRPIEPRQLAREGRQGERGEDSLGLLPRMAAVHDRNPIAQIEREAEIG